MFGDIQTDHLQCIHSYDDMNGHEWKVFYPEKGVCFGSIFFDATAHETWVFLPEVRYVPQEGKFTLYSIPCFLMGEFAEVWDRIKNINPDSPEM